MKAKLSANVLVANSWKNKNMNNDEECFGISIIFTVEHQHSLLVNIRGGSLQFSAFMYPLNEQRKNHL